jgi:cysteine synthase A
MLQQLDPMIESRFRSLRHLIGNTPMIAVRCRFRGRKTTVYAKFEVRNFTGSIKDRMALRIMEQAYASGSVRPGDTITEATSGNTGISFAAVGRALGHEVRIYMPDWMSQERVQVIESLGAKIVPISHEEGGFKGAIREAERFARNHEHVFLPRQFESPANVEAHHASTGPEILAQLRRLEVEPTAFVAGVGTGGTVTGVGAYLCEQLGASFPAHPLEPANSPTLRTGNKVGKHRIQGISDEFIPPIVHLDELAEIVDVWDGDAIIAAQRLACELGWGVGISSGANLLGALQVAERQGEGAVVATVFCDSNKKYLSTDLCREEEVREGYLSPDLELLGCSVLPPS